jgi:hypothetical protein
MQEFVTYQEIKQQGKIKDMSKIKIYNLKTQI